MKKGYVIVLIVIVVIILFLLGFFVLRSKEVTVTLNVNNGSQKIMGNVIDGKVEMPVAPTREGYIFVGWYNGDELFDFNTKVTKDIELTARWEVSSEYGDTFIVSFDTAGGSSIEYLMVKRGSTIIKPTNPTKKGYTFVEWQLNGKTYDFDTTVNENITLKAVWKKSSSTSTNQGTSDGSTTNPNDQGTSGGSTTNPNDQGTSGGSTTNPNDQGTSGGSTTNPNNQETVDTIPPTVSYSLVGGTYHGARSITITMNDTGGSGLGIRNVSVYNLTVLDTGRSVFNYTGSTYTVNLTSGTWRVATYVADKAGNILKQEPMSSNYFYQDYYITTQTKTQYRYRDCTSCGRCSIAGCESYKDWQSQGSYLTSGDETKVDFNKKVLCSYRDVTGDISANERYICYSYVRYCAQYRQNCDTCQSCDSWGAWSAWSDTVYTGSYSRQVETQQVNY